MSIARWSRIQVVTGLLRRDDKARTLPVGLLPTGVHNYFAASQHFKTGKL